MTDGMTDLLAGVSILEFGGGAAGPVATRYFADHGADVIRVESRQRPDFLRLLKLTPNTPGGLDGGEHFAVLNANKRSVALNLSTPEGVAVARRLALRVDAVAENFAPGAMAKWKLDYASLVVDRPDLVMISTCLNGQTGPQRFYPGFGGQGSALSGFNHLTGWPDRAPVGPYGTITDSLSPRFAALLLASALLHRQRTGHGQHIDLAQVEGGIVCLSESIATFTANGEILGRLGNRSRHEAPHGVFRCADEDGRERWIAIVVHDDTDWQRLVQALGRPAWALEPQLATTAGRLAAVDALEARLEEWTSSQRASALAASLQAASIEAGPVADLADLHDDPQIAHRGHFGDVHHPVLGTHPAERHAIRFSDMEPRLRSPAPRLGEHTDAVLHDLLGMSTDEIGRLRDAGVLD
jgi:crotonobetainyl-CoA:carnitine CoA-transferase CaiB-like acyl-CoA transferase